MLARNSIILKSGLVWLTLALAACVAHDDGGGSDDTSGSEAEAVGVSDEPSPADSLPAAEEEIQRTELATLEFPDRRSIRFSVDEDAHAIVVEEHGPVAEGVGMPLLMRAPMRDLDALQVYMALTPADREVPRALYELGVPEGARPALTQRALVDSLAPMPAHVVSYRLVDTDQDAEYMPSLCGANGSTAFQALCSTSNAPEQWCASGKHTWHGRESSGNYNKSEGLTVSCQASVQTTHRRKVALTWWENTFNMDTDQYWHFTRVENYAPASKYKRYVRMDRYNPTSVDTSVSYIRSWIGFRN
ncbi:uncharacterized protein SOCEGT47_033070 [Sorangium cellulosum]|uniref:Uncharacterized protein n=1 Tax=Sorangium cellulosum TaxID=56 RepID=A0A4P2Q0R6_SORCE|nr:hypothetical protein [Sorangium cellulosum]AUX22795.1 uncharacterized protein SOCEGT47_033070 [Sorangium cellulosum]